MSIPDPSPAPDESRPDESRPRESRPGEPLPDKPRPDEPLRRRLVLVLGSLAAFGPLATDVYLPALPQVGADFAASSGAVALTLSGSVVGLGVGQLLVGPLSDRFGRRRPLLAGLAVFAAASLLCALAPTLPLLVAARLLQALGGSAGIVLSRSVARDLRTGDALVRLFAVLVGISSLAPVVAPVLGAQLVRVTSWHGIFVVLGAVSALVLAASAAWLPETLPPQRRHAGSALRSYRALLADRQFVVLVVSGSLAFAVLFSYITASPFVLQDGLGLSAQQFSLVFALNAVGLTIATRFATRVPLPVGASALLAGALLVLLGAVLPAAVPVGFLVVATSFGLVIPVVSGRAMATEAGPAGAAAALLGATQFVVGGAAAPVASTGAASSSLVLGLVATVAAALALGGVLLAPKLGHHEPRAAADARPLPTVTSEDMPQPDGAPALTRRHVDVPTPDGAADSYLVRPAADGHHPGVLLFMDAIGLRSRIAEMADRVAAEGYTVLAPNLVYRAGRAPVIPDIVARLQSEDRDAVMTELRPMMAALTPDVAARDTAGYVAFLDEQTGGGPIATTGYCMGGALSLRAAAQLPERVVAAASFHGGNLAPDDRAGPQHLAPQIRAEVYAGHADHDPSMPPEQVARFAAALAAAGVRVTAEVYEGASHGFTMSDMAVFDAAAEQRHWDALLGLLRRALPAG